MTVDEEPRIIVESPRLFRNCVNEEPRIDGDDPLRDTSRIPNQLAHKCIDVCIQWRSYVQVRGAGGATAPQLFENY